MPVLPSRRDLLSLAATGDRASLLAMLQAIDPNGSWGDAESVADGLDPLSVAEARSALISFAGQLA